VSISVEEEMLQLKAAERVGKDDSQSVVAQIEPAQCRQVGERAHFERLEATLAEVEVLERHERRQVDSAHHRRLERVTVEVQLKAGDRDAGRDGGQTAPRAVDDTTGRVAEAEARTAETVAWRQSRDDDRLEHTRHDGSRQQTAASRPR